jgi:hypothetical protein
MQAISFVQRTSSSTNGESVLRYLLIFDFHEAFAHRDFAVAPLEKQSASADIVG